MSSSENAFIEADQLADSVDSNAWLSRAKFEELFIDLFKQMKTPVESVLHDANLVKRVISECPCLRVDADHQGCPASECLLECEGVEQVNHPGQKVVTFGDAVQANILAGHSDEKADHILLSLRR